MVSGERESQTEKTSAKALRWESVQRDEGPARGPVGDSSEKGQEYGCIRPENEIVFFCL